MNLKPERMANWMAEMEYKERTLEKISFLNAYRNFPLTSSHLEQPEFDPCTNLQHCSKEL